MARRRVVPTGVERTFGSEEIIVSKTDPKGIIQYANRIFQRISCYEESEVVGAPHSLIRHPDMPRGVFRYMWEEIEAGREIFAYVVNLAADGAHYWVLAHVTPSFGPDGRIIGYHSNRRLPDPQAVRTVSGVYKELCRVERRAGSGREQADVGRAALAEVLAGKNTSYSQFVWSLITPARAGRTSVSAPSVAVRPRVRAA
jgi:PAS domain S-box-containing protein